MPTRLILLILFVLLILSLSVNFIQWKNAESRNTVIAVPDGDSLDLSDGRRIRLLGIDAPERGRCMAREARDTLVLLAMGKQVRPKNIVTDDFGRQLAIVIVDGVPLQRALLAAGLARNRSSFSNPYNQVLKDAQEIAKAAKLGIWSDTCRSQTPANEDCTIKGNTRAGEKHFYLPTCKQYDQVIIDLSFGDRWFCTESEAQSAGFSKAFACPSASP
jgi:endonuclease YncB( thermonuclease family)